MKFKTFLNWFFNCYKYDDVKITKEVFREIHSTVINNRDNILLKFKDFKEWDPTPISDLPRITFPEQLKS